MVQLLHYMPKGTKVQNNSESGQLVSFPQGNLFPILTSTALCTELLLALGFSPLSVVLCSSVSYGTSLCIGL